MTDIDEQIAALEAQLAELAAQRPAPPTVPVAEIKVGDRLHGALVVAVEATEAGYVVAYEAVEGGPTRSVFAADDTVPADALEIA